MAVHANPSLFYLLYGITQCYLPPDTGECTLLWTQPGKPVLDLPTPERSELIWVVGYIPKWFTCSNSKGGHPSRY